MIPINHFSGSYICDERDAAPAAATSDRVVLRYLDNPNGSVDDIAGIANEAGNVVGSDAAPRAGLARAARAPRTGWCCCARSSTRRPAGAAA